MDKVAILSFLFGTEEAVKRRRQIVLLREKVVSAFNPEGCICGLCELTVICSGSLGEGVYYPRSDDDIMFVDNSPSKRVYVSYEEAIQNRGYYMIPSTYSPGFCVLQKAHQNGLALSSKLFREDFVQSRHGHVEHGPCASITDGNDEFDFAKCLSSSIWPTMANEWIMRSRGHDWPSQELIRTVVTGGCHFVPIGNPDSPLRDYEWRVSFSLAERSLIHKFSHVQFLVYNLLKLILKRVIEIRIPNVLCSYFIKTVMFFGIENTASTLWVTDKLEECYTKSLSLLYHFIDKMECPNYFIPGNNMMRRKVNTNNRGPLLVIIHELMALGIVGSLRNCDDVRVANALVPGVSLATVEIKQDIDFSRMYLISAVESNFTTIIEKHTRPEDLLLSFRTILLSVISNLTNLSNNLMNLVIQLMFRQLGMKCIQISQDMAGENKSIYQMIRQGQGLLCKGCNIDISSGRLQLASYMYLTGRFHYGLEIIKIVLSKYAPYVMSSQSQHTAQSLYMGILCNKNYSLMDKLKRGWALDVEYLKPYVVLAPTPIKIIHNMVRFRIPISPLLHAYFLQGLCFYQSRDITSMNISVKSLEDTVMALHPCCCLSSMFYGRVLLGYMKMLQQDYHASCRYLVAAYFMRKKVSKRYTCDLAKDTDSYLILLACLLDRACNRKV